MRSTFTLVAAAAVIAPAASQNMTGAAPPAQGQSIPPASMNLISSANNTQLSVAFNQPDNTVVPVQPAQLMGKSGKSDPLGQAVVASPAMIQLD